MGNPVCGTGSEAVTPPVPLNSDDLLEDIEHHFRVTAGPGAGKTHWLVNHIRHVARTSRRLKPSSRICVISYTNVAVREIVRRLEAAAEVTDATTIHSFLFRNVVRPYVHLLRDADGRELIAHHLIDTHGEHYPSRKVLDEWLTEFNSRQLLRGIQEGQFNLLKARLRSLTVRIDGSGTAYFAPCKSEPRDAGIRPLLTSDRLLNYKRRYWNSGMLDHEDVLYFSFRLLSEFPILKQFLSARFPYLFIDEFQDTLPVQGELVRWLAKEGTVVGVIGDPEQAIFGFVDASASYFNEFRLDGHRGYSIEGNRRSTTSIVTFLNRMRTDGLSQRAIRSNLGVPPVVYGGDLGESLAHARGDGNTPFLVLARRNDDVARARRAAGHLTNDPWELLEGADPDRSRFMNLLAMAVDLAQRQLYDIAIQRLVRGISSRNGFRKPITYDGTISITNRRAVALSLLTHALQRHNELAGKTALDFYNMALECAPKCLAGLKLPKVTPGKTFHKVASECEYSDLMHALKTPDETRSTRTVHQAKGAQEKAVFVVLNEEQIGHILAPSKTPADDEPRITYVGLSRAEDHLFLYCPTASRLPEFEAIGCTTTLIGSEPALKAKAPRKKRGASKTSKAVE